MLQPQLVALVAVASLLASGMVPWKAWPAALWERLRPEMAGPATALPFFTGHVQQCSFIGILFAQLNDIAAPFGQFPNRAHQRCPATCFRNQRIETRIGQLPTGVVSQREGRFERMPTVATQF